MQEEKITREEFRVSGKDVVDKVKELVEAGKVRKIVIRNEEGKAVIECPMAFSVVGAALLPVLAAIGAVAALMTKCTIVVEKEV